MLRQPSLRKKRTPHPAPEPLEDRVELSGGGSIARVATEVARIDGHVRAQAARLGAVVENRTARLDAAVGPSSSTLSSYLNPV